MRGGKKKTLFITHGAAVALWADELDTMLAKKMPEIDIESSSDLAPGEVVSDEISQLIREAYAITLLIGAEPTKDEQHQWAEVLQAYWDDQSKLLLAILFDDASPPPFLRGFPVHRIPLSNRPGDAVVTWIVRCLEGSPAASSPVILESVSSSPSQPWSSRLNDDVDTRSPLLRRLDATISALSEERPDEEELRENRKALLKSCQERQDPKSLALAHLNIGLIDFELREHEMALDHLNNALEICESAPGEEYPNRTSILIPLAETFAEKEDFGKAISRMKQAADLRIAEEGPESPAVTEIHQELGALLVRAKRYEEAAELLAKTLEVNYRELGTQHPQVAANEMWLSVAQEELHQRDPSTPAGTLGDEPLKKVTRLLGIGYTLIAIDDLCGAQGALSRAVKLAKISPEIPDPIKASCHFYNGIALYKTRQYPYATKELRAAADDSRRAGIEDGWAASMFYLGSALQANGNTDDAVQVLTEVLPEVKRLFGKSSVEVADNLYNLGLALQDQGDRKAARQRIEAAVRIGSEIDGVDDPRVGKYQRGLERLDRVAA
jgi:tetratricopeptide (TPR) repeat protein